MFVQTNGFKSQCDHYTDLLTVDVGKVMTRIFSELIFSQRGELHQRTRRKSIKDDDMKEDSPRYYKWDNNERYWIKRKENERKISRCIRDRYIKIG
jgi:hypothetical protein